MKSAVLIPAKGFAHAKKRLSSVLGPRQRSRLAESMFRHVLQATQWARGEKTTFTITADAQVSRLARSLGVEVIAEREERGQSHAVSLAIGEIAQRGFQAVLILPGDLPLLSSSDVESVLKHLPCGPKKCPFALLVPSWNRMGTNALLLSPPHLIDPRFGYDSFCVHVSALASKGVSFKILENWRIALDVDEPDDLQHVGLPATDLDPGCGRQPASRL